MMTKYSIDEIITESAHQFSVPVHSIKQDPQIGDLNLNKPRLAAVWLARQLAQASDNQLADTFNVPAKYAKSMFKIADQLVQFSPCKPFCDKVSSIKCVLRNRMKADLKQYQDVAQCSSLQMPAGLVVPNGINPAAKSVVCRAKSSLSSHSQNIACKSAYRPLEKGTMLLLDTANLIGKIGPEYAAEHLAAIVGSLEEHGYKALLFWEHRSLGWTLGHQVSAGDVEALKEFAHSRNVSLVREEADLVLLQAAQEIPDSVIVTGDRLADYADVFPEIVATSRHRSFSVVRVENRTMLMIFGLKDAIVLTDAVASEPEVAKEFDFNDTMLGVDEETLRRRAVRPQVESCRHGLLGVADGCILHGDVRRGLELLGRVARKKPKVYREMADVFSDDSASLEDVRMAIRYDRLADRFEKAKRECGRRKCRQRAERRRNDNAGRARFEAA